MALATQADVEAILGRDLTASEEAKVEAALNKASARVRGFTRQKFEQVINDVVILHADGDIIRLPQRPVLSVTSVQALGSGGVPNIPVVGFYWDGGDEIDLKGIAAVINLPAWWEDTNYSSFQVTYSHGYDVIPEDVVGVVANMVAEAFQVATATGDVPGMKKEKTGNYFYELADGVTSAIKLTEDDKEILLPYKRTTGTTMMGLR